MKPAALLILLAGCGGPGSFDGAVASNTLTVRDAIFSVARDDHGRPVYAQLILSDAPKACDALKSNRNPKGATTLSLSLYRISSGAIVAPGSADYTVSGSLPLSAGGDWASGAFTRNDPNCTNTIPEQNAVTRSGTLNVFAYQPQPGGVITGNFDLTFGEQADRATGGFTASFCDATPVELGQMRCE